MDEGRFYLTNVSSRRQQIFGARFNYRATHSNQKLNLWIPHNPASLVNTLMIETISTHPYHSV